MGARYMTLTHGCNTPWADAAQVEVGDFPPRVGGLSEFGEKVVLSTNLIEKRTKGCPRNEQTGDASRSLTCVKRRNAQGAEKTFQLK